MERSDRVWQAYQLARCVGNKMAQEVLEELFPKILEARKKEEDEGFYIKNFSLTNRE